MVNGQGIMGISLCSQEINKSIIVRKLDLTYDLESILEKLRDKAEAQSK